MSAEAIEKKRLSRGRPPGAKNKLPAGKRIYATVAPDVYDLIRLSPRKWIEAGVRLLRRQTEILAAIRANDGAILDQDAAVRALLDRIDAVQMRREVAATVALGGPIILESKESMKREKTDLPEFGF